MCAHIQAYTYISAHAQAETTGSCTLAHAPLRCAHFYIPTQIPRCTVFHIGACAHEEKGTNTCQHVHTCAWCAWGHVLPRHRHTGTCAHMSVPTDKHVMSLLWLMPAKDRHTHTQAHIADMHAPPSLLESWRYVEACPGQIWPSVCNVLPSFLTLCRAWNPGPESPSPSQPLPSV